MFENPPGAPRLIGGKFVEGGAESFDAEIAGAAVAVEPVEEGGDVEELRAGVHEAEIDELFGGDGFFGSRHGDQ